MAKSKAAIKSRIKSVNSTKKITGAMELISTVKLQKNAALLGKNRYYAETLKQMADQIFAGDLDLDSVYLKENSSNIRYCFVFVSDMGLCGGYNTNLRKYLEANFSKEDRICLFGTSEYKHIVNAGFNMVNDGPVSSDDVDFNILKKALQSAIDAYVRGEVGKISIVYTRFVNNITFVPDQIQLLPFVKEEGETAYREVLMEPSRGVIINHLIPLMLNNVFYNCYLQAKASEHGSRRFAMENATDNANELIEDLTLAYNQARQAAITQEITEIVGGADAL